MGIGISRLCPKAALPSPATLPVQHPHARIRQTDKSLQKNLCFVNHTLQNENSLRKTPSF